jgi:hypothetical protein
VILSAFILRSSDSSELSFWCVIGFCAGIGGFFYGFRVLQRRRLLLDTPFSKIRSASMGLVEVSGLAVGPYTLIAPITGRPCYYHRTLVWEFRQGTRKKEWVQIAGECAHVPFFIDDNTGRVLVDPRGADLDLHCDFKEKFCDSSFSMNDLAPDSVRDFLARYGIVTGNNLRVEEYCIKPKNSLFILGTLGENAEIEIRPEPMYEDIVTDSPSYVPLLSVQSIAFAAGSANNELRPRLLAARAAAGAHSGHGQDVHLLPRIDLSTFKTPHDQQVAGALLKAGIASPAAWAAAGLNLPQPPVKKATAVDKSDPNRFPPVVLMKGNNDRTFLISWRSQQELARSLGWKCVLMIWGGPALALLCLYVFLELHPL